MVHAPLLNLNMDVDHRIRRVGAPPSSTSPRPDATVDNNNQTPSPAPTKEGNAWTTFDKEKLHQSETSAGLQNFLCRNSYVMHSSLELGGKVRPRPGLVAPCDPTCDCQRCRPRNMAAFKVEHARVARLRSYHILDTAPEASYDRIVHLAQRFFNADMCSIMLIDNDRAWFKAKLGLDGWELDRKISFCTYTIRWDEVFVVLDTHQHEVFHNHPLVVQKPFIRFYAGAPITTKDGLRLGALCIIDATPRVMFGHQERENLKRMAATVMEQMDMGLLRLRRRTHQ